MAIEEHFIDNGSWSFWQWPVSVKFLDGDLKLTGDHKELVMFNPRVINILIAKDWVPDVSYKDSVDVLIVLSSAKIDPKRTLEYVGGIFYVYGIKDVGNWMHRVLTSLADNKSIVEAIRENSNDGYFIYDKRLTQTTRVSDVIGRTVETLNKEGDKIFSIDNELIGKGKVEMPARQLAAVLAGKAGRLKYGLRYREVVKMADLLGQISTQFVLANYIGFNTGSNVFTRTMMGNLNANTRSLPKPDPARFLQARFRNSEEQSVRSLRSNSEYKLSAFIGTPKADTLVANEAIDNNVIFEDTLSRPEELKILFFSNQAEGVQEALIVLPRYGDSSEARFAFKTSQPGPFESSLMAYHKNRLIQEVEIKGDITESGETAELKITSKFCARKNLSSLNTRTQFGASIVHSPEGGGASAWVKSGAATSFNFNRALIEEIDEIKDKIQDAVIDPDLHPDDLQHPNNVKLLRELAYHGNNILVDHLKLQPGEIHTEPLQIVSNTDVFVPMDFVYSLRPPADDAGLCPNAAEALKTGECKGCFPFDESPARHICPLGFWCFSRIVERAGFNASQNDNSGKDYSVATEPGPRNTLPIFGSTVWAATERIDTVVANSVATIRKAVDSHSGIKKETGDWDSWKSEVNASNPDSLVLVVHLEEKNGHTHLEIGHEKLLRKQYLDDTRISHPNSFVIILGCEITKPQKYGFDVSSRLMSAGAKLVVSNFTKILGRQAAPLASDLIEFLKQGASKNSTVGEVLLALRRHLLAQGKMVSLSLIAHGDADWKITT